MTAHMDSDGVIHIQPQSMIEAYALKQWVKEAMNKPQGSGDTAWIKGSHIIVDTEAPRK